MCGSHCTRKLNKTEWLDAPVDPPVGQPTRIDVRWPDASLETCQALSDGSSDYVVSIEMHHSRDHVAPHSRPARMATVPVQDEVDVQTRSDVGL